MRQAHNISDKGDPDKRDAGAILIELALVMPFLVILFITIVDLGLLIREHQVLQNAAREGARFSSLPQNCISCRPVACADCVGGCGGPGCKTQAQVQAAIAAHVVNYMAQEGITISASNITINQCFPISVTVGGSTITAFASEVTITYDRALLVSPSPAVGDATLTGRAVFRDLYGPSCP
ncbi:MAG: TadE family protein [Blastocatellia bacterium]